MLTEFQPNLLFRISLTRAVSTSVTLPLQHTAGFQILIWIYKVIMDRVTIKTRTTEIKVITQTQVHSFRQTHLVFQMQITRPLSTEVKG